MYRIQLFMVAVVVSVCLIASCAATRSQNAPVAEMERQNGAEDEPLKQMRVAEPDSTVSPASAMNDSQSAHAKFSRDLLVGKKNGKKKSQEIDKPKDPDPPVSWTESSKYTTKDEDYPNREPVQEPDWIETPSSGKGLLTLLLILGGLSALYFGVFKNLKSFSE